MIDKIARYEWLLKCMRKSNRESYTDLPLTQNTTLQFFNHAFLHTGRSLILQGVLKTKTPWTMETLKDKLPDTEIEILNHRNKYETPDKHKEEQQTQITLHKFIEDIISVQNTNDFYSVPFNKNELAFKPIIDDILPISVLKSVKMDNTFIWLGPAGTITPFHYDTQAILMGQLIGKKRVLIIPSWDLSLCNNNYKTFCDIPFTKPLENPSLDEPQIFECILYPGDALFVPVGWSHYVEGLSPSITLSFTGLDLDNNYYEFFPKD